MVHGELKRRSGHETETLHSISVLPIQPKAGNISRATSISMNHTVLEQIKKASRRHQDLLLAPPPFKYHPLPFPILAPELAHTFSP